MKENLENNLNITISFDNKYNGNKKDRIRYKTSNFSLVFIGGLIIFCAGIYLMFFHFRPRPIGIQKYEAIFIFVLGIVLIIAEALLLSVIAIARVPINRLFVPACLFVYILTIIASNIELTRQLESKKSEESKKA